MTRFGSVRGSKSMHPLSQIKRDVQGTISSVNGSIFMKDLSPGCFGWFCPSEVLPAELFPLLLTRNTSTAAN